MDGESRCLCELVDMARFRCPQRTAGGNASVTKLRLISDTDGHRSRTLPDGTDRLGRQLRKPAWLQFEVPTCSQASFVVLGG